MPTEIKLPGMPPRRLQAFTADEVGALLEHAAPRDYAVLALGVAPPAAGSCHSPSSWSPRSPVTIELFGLGPEQTVFFSPRGSVWRRGWFNDSVWKPARERAGLPRE